MLENSEVIDNASCNQNPKPYKELALLKEITLACLPNDVGDRKHGFMRRQGLGLLVLQQAENAGCNTDEEPEVENPYARNSCSKNVKLNLCQ